MNLTYATVTIRPWRESHGLIAVRVEVRTNWKTFTCEHYLPHDSFESEFDQVWPVMKQELDKLIADVSKGETVK